MVARSHSRTRPVTRGQTGNPAWCLSPVRGPGSLRVQLWVVPEEAVLVERDASGGGEVGGEARARGNPSAERAQQRQAGNDAFQRVWKGIAQPLHHLEGGQVDVAALPADEPLPPAAGVA